MNKTSILLLGLALFTPQPAQTCTLPENEVLTIGCSTECNIFYRFRVQTTAWAMGHKVRFRDLSKASDLKTAMLSVDAILMPGGADIDPKYYLPSVSEELQRYTQKNLQLVKFSKEGERRDPVEFKLVRTYSEDDDFRDLPLLGICRGLQMMSVGQGIPLYLDIKTELGIPNRIGRFDRASIVGSSLMDEIYPQETVLGFKLHHQGIRVDYLEENSASYPNTRITAYSHDRKIAEAIEYTHRPALGVQYHPERSFTAASAPVFRWFLNRACTYKTREKR